MASGEETSRHGFGRQSATFDATFDQATPTWYHCRHMVLQFGRFGKACAQSHRKLPEAQPAACTATRAPAPVPTGPVVLLAQLPPSTAALQTCAHVCDVRSRRQIEVLRRANVDVALCRAGARGQPCQNALVHSGTTSDVCLVHEQHGGRVRTRVSRAG